MAHTFTNLLYHIVFGTKEHRPTIDAEWRGNGHAYIGGIIREIGGIALIVNGIADHVHVVTKLPPTIAVSDAVRVIKTNSSKWIRGEKLPKFSWQQGFSAFTISESVLPSVIRYVKGQEEHHRRKTFAEEYIEFLALSHGSRRGLHSFAAPRLVRNRDSPCFHGSRRGLHCSAAPRLPRQPSRRSRFLL